jgi:hypothetical protein
VICRDRSGIYTVEQHLKTHWGDQLSLIALENEPGHYTLRRVTRSKARPRARLRPAQPDRSRRRRRPPGKRWGGSADIGGSPRPRGTQLASAEVIEILERAYRKPGLAMRAARTARRSRVGLAFLAFWPLAEALPAPDLSKATPAFRAAFELGRWSRCSRSRSARSRRAARRAGGRGCSAGACPRPALVAARAGADRVRDPAARLDPGAARRDAGRVRGGRRRRC